MLNGTFALYDVPDVEEFCSKEIARSGLELSYYQREDLLTFLVEMVWELSLRYESGIIRSKSTVRPHADGQGFGCWARLTLRRRVVDWQRGNGRRTKWQFANRTYERQLPSFVALDDREERADHGLALDADAYWLRDVLGLQREGDRQGSRTANGNGKGKTRHVARRAARE